MMKAVGAATSPQSTPARRIASEWIKTGIDHRREECVTAEAHKGLLPDRNEAGEPGEQVPVLRQRNQREEEEEVLQQRAARRRPAAQGERQDRDAGDRAEASCRARRPRCGRCPAMEYRVAPAYPLQSAARGKSPRGRITSTARKARWPARICHSGLIAAPTACATPSTMPPASVPQRLPSPPMITASNA